ncbi:hypothetical protein PNEG_00295 [Pneumocystis murina B123]|uniref:RRM domain-containing protein n=1 Tax=Pneumocystis murina (strain B123) TaxID=1069680 RepID=M7PBM9_PNEMU|nr:hypothetical protein PNEG_00295 [Pneumocystis murina B123]EMR11265.1 hypothetical protein PNEG_00295 [Pneumocystis murina B123]
MASASSEAQRTIPNNHQSLPGVVSRPLTEDGRPLKCYIGNLSNQCRMYHLREKFSPFGTIINVELKPNIGCGFVEFVDPESCIKACDALDGTELFGQTLRVETQKQVYGIRKIVTEKLEGCFNCGAKNHWAKHCPKMPPPGTPQNVSPPRSSMLSSEAYGYLKPYSHSVNNYDYPRYYSENLPHYRQPCLNGYRDPYYYAPRDYIFRDRDTRDLRNFQKYRNRGQWNLPSAEKIPENATVSHKRYANSEPWFNESHQLTALPRTSQISTESKFKAEKSLDEDKDAKTQLRNSTHAETMLKTSEKDFISEKKLSNDQNLATCDSPTLAKETQINDSLENKKVIPYRLERKERVSSSYSEPRYNNCYNCQDHIHSESYDRPYLSSKYPNNNPHYDHHVNYTNRHALFRMRSKYPDGYRYCSYSEPYLPYTPYDSNYRSRKSLQHLDYSSNSRMDCAPLNYSQGYLRRCSPLPNLYSPNLYSPTYNYGYSEYR